MDQTCFFQIRTKKVAYHFYDVIWPNARDPSWGAMRVQWAILVRNRACLNNAPFASPKLRVQRLETSDILRRESLHRNQDHYDLANTI